MSKSFETAVAKMGSKEEWQDFESEWIRSELSLLARFLYTVTAEEMYRITGDETLKSIELKKDQKSV